MAKKKRVPLNRLVTSETFESVKELALVLECSEGEVLDQAVMLLESASRNGKGTETVGASVREVVREEPSEEEFDETEERGQIAENALQGGPVSLEYLRRVAAGEFTRTATVTETPKNARCIHCGERFAGSRFANLCEGCQEVGHGGDPRECGECGVSRGGV